MPLLRVPAGVKHGWCLNTLLTMPSLAASHNSKQSCLVRHFQIKIWSTDRADCLAKVLGLASGSSGYARRALQLRCAELVGAPMASNVNAPL